MTFVKEIKLQSSLKFELDDNRFVYYLGPIEFMLEYEKMNKFMEKFLDSPKKEKERKFHLKFSEKNALKYFNTYLMDA